MNASASAVGRWWPWLLGVAVFYGAWLVVVASGDRWATVAAHWPMALSMLFGSYIAGSTPMGGGSVGFPILVLWFDQPATLGRDFSFAVQAIGMTSASGLILVRRQMLAWRVLRGALIGTAVGTPLGVIVIAPLIPGWWITLVFAVVWASFGVLHLARLGEIAGHAGKLELPGWGEFRLGLALGFGAGATVAAVTGVGIDMVIYTVLVLLLRTDLRIAIPTSVVIMAATSVLGILLKVARGEVQPGVFENWLAAAPVVALGAPLGALVVDKVGRRPTLCLVAMLCIGQFIWTCHRERAVLGWPGIALAVAAVALCLGGFEALRRQGARWAARQGASSCQRKA